MPTASTCTYKNCYIRAVYNCEVSLSESQSQCLVFFLFIKPHYKLLDNAISFLGKKSLKLYLHFKLYTTVLEMRRILSLSTDLLQHQELSQSSQIGLCVFLEMCFRRCAHFHAQLQVPVQMQFRVNVWKVGASWPTNYTEVFWICLVKWKRFGPRSFPWSSLPGRAKSAELRSQTLPPCIVLILMQN